MAAVAEVQVRVTDLPAVLAEFRRMQAKIDAHEATLARIEAEALRSVHSSVAQGDGFRAGERAALRRVLWIIDPTRTDAGGWICNTCKGPAGACVVDPCERRPL